MDVKISLSPADEQGLINLFIRHADLHKQAALFRRYFGKALWWFGVHETSLSSKKTKKISLHPHSAAVWQDPRFHDWKCKKKILSQTVSHFKQDRPYHFKCSKHGLVTCCIPVVIRGTRLGVIGLTHLRPSMLKKPILDLLYFNIHALASQVWLQYEMTRLSESVRPRAIALSTVHTVHRLINSTLNLAELLERLARLTSQVLRSKTCAIFLHDPNKKKLQTIVERAKVGFSGKHSKSLRFFRPGYGLEGRVFSTAKMVLRNNLISVPLIDEEVMGVITLTRKKDGRGFDAFDREILTTLAEEAVIAIKNALLYEEQKRVTLGAIQSMAAILGTRYGHTRQLSTNILIKIGLSIADMLKLSDEDEQAIHYAILLKDASKIGLPDEIIKKPTKLTGEEYQMIRQHPVKGANILHSFESLKPVAPIILYSHEHFDGTGYPKGLKGQEIPIGARIISVVNAFDALIAGRPYKSRATLKEAIEELRNHKGSQFDPNVVDAFERVISKARLAKLLSGI